MNKYLTTKTRQLFSSALMSAQVFGWQSQSSPFGGRNSFGILHTATVKTAANTINGCFIVDKRFAVNWMQSSNECALLMRTRHSHGQVCTMGVSTSTPERTHLAHRFLYLFGMYVLCAMCNVHCDNMTFGRFCCCCCWWYVRIATELKFWSGEPLHRIVWFMHDINEPFYLLFMTLTVYRFFSLLQTYWARCDIATTTKTEFFCEDVERSVNTFKSWNFHYCDICSDFATQTRSRIWLNGKHYYRLVDWVMKDIILVQNRQKMLTICVMLVFFMRNFPYKWQLRPEEMWLANIVDL